MTPESKETVIIRKKKEKCKGKSQKPWEAPGSFFNLQPEEGGPNATCLLATSANLSLSTATVASVLTEMQCGNSTVHV